MPLKGAFIYLKNYIILLRWYTTLHSLLFNILLPTPLTDIYNIPYTVQYIAYQLIYAQLTYKSCVSYMA